LATDAETYADAHRQANSGKPMVVLVSTEWCAPCQKMKKTVLPEVRRRGLLKKVAFAIVNPDHNRKLARKLTGPNVAIPQLIMYRRTAKGWRRTKLVGGQSIQSVERFISQGIASDISTRKDIATRKITSNKKAPKAEHTPRGESVR
jgi:thioredoxin-like negative regulator of GroEL